MSIDSNSAQHNRNIITKILQTLDELPFAPQSEDDIWYIVNKNFIDALREYESKKIDVCPMIIENRMLLEDRFKVDCKTRLLEEYENGNGRVFVLYSKEGMDLLENYFQIDTKIPRAVYPKLNKRQHIMYYVDIQPLKICVYSKNPDEYTNPAKSLIVLLRNTTIKDVLIEINGGYENRAFKRNLFYADDIADGRRKDWQCIFLNNSTDYSIEKRICDYDIGPKSVLLITTERVDVKCLTNDSDSGMRPKNELGNIRAREENNILNKPIQHVFEQGGDRGLCNLGNTCFMNSSLQCLSKLLKFSNYFLSGAFWKHINYNNPVGQHGRLAKAYYETLIEMWQLNKRNEPYAPKILKQAISEKRDEFYGYQQHDSQELLAFLLDGLHEDLNLITKKPYYEEKLQGGMDKSDVEVAEASWQRHKEINNSIIVDLFQGQYRSKLQCPQCNKVSITFDPFMYLSIPIPPKKNHRIWFHVRVHEELPIGIRFSCSFYGSQDVLTLKMFFLKFMKNLKNMRKDIVLHHKSIIRNQMMDEKVAFGFHAKSLDEYDEMYDDNDSNNSKNGRDEEVIEEKEDLSNYVNIFKQRKKIHNILQECDVDMIYRNICKMCNISDINELKIENLCFIYSKLRGVPSSDFFQVLNNMDSVIELHTRAQQGINHLFVFLVPEMCTYLTDRRVEVKSDEAVEIHSSSSDVVNQISEKTEEEEEEEEGEEEEEVAEEEEENNEKVEVEEKKLMNNKNHLTPNAVKRRKANSSSPLRKNLESDIGEDCEEMQANKNKAETVLTNNINQKNMFHGEQIQKIEMRDEIETTYENVGIHLNGSNRKGITLMNREMNERYRISNEEEITSGFFSVMVVPMCKHDQPLYRLKNNDLPLLFHLPYTVTNRALYERVKKAYQCASEEQKQKAKLSRKEKESKVEKKESAQNKLSRMLKIQNNNGDMDDTKELFNGQSAEEGGEKKKDEEEETEEDGDEEETEEHSGSYLDRLKLFIPTYNLREDLKSKSELGYELEKDDTYVSSYVKNLEDKRLIIIHLSTYNIKRELCLDIKTLTVLEFEEKYGIDTCLKLFSEEEHLDEHNTWYCGHCKLHVQAYKKLDLFRMPIILILHLKRFNNCNRWIRSKLDSYVYYPHKESEYLNMAPYILADGLKHMITLDSNYQPVYELVGVNCHTGGLCGGHYFAYVKLNKKWYLYNDAYVSEVEESTVNTKNAYLLFYQLIAHRDEKFVCMTESNIIDNKNITEEQAIMLANESYYNS